MCFPHETGVSNCPKAEPGTELIKLGVTDTWRVQTLDAKRQKPEAGLKSKIMTKQDFSACHCQLGKLTNYKSIMANLGNAHYVLKGVVVRENVRKPGKQILAWLSH